MCNKGHVNESSACTSRLTPAWLATNTLRDIVVLLLDMLFLLLYFQTICPLCRKREHRHPWKCDLWPLGADVELSLALLRWRVYVLWLFGLTSVEVWALLAVLHSTHYVDWLMFGSFVLGMKHLWTTISEQRRWLGSQHRLSATYNPALRSWSHPATADLSRSHDRMRQDLTMVVNVVLEPFYRL